MHQFDAHETGKCEGAGDAALGGLGETQQEIGDQADDDVIAYSILTFAQEVSGFQGPLDPAEEQLDLPAALVRAGFLRSDIEIIGDEARHLSAGDADAHFVYCCSVAVRLAAADAPLACMEVVEFNR